VETNGDDKNNNLGLGKGLCYGILGGYYWGYNR